jgi:DNA-binding beta-propeller fold protein YncE
MLPRILGRRPPGPGGAPVDAPVLGGIEPLFTSLPGRPFGVAPSADGRRAFVSMPRPDACGLLVLSPGAPWQLDRVLWTEPEVRPRGMALDRTGRHLAIANTAGGLVVVDTQRLVDGADDPVAAVIASPGEGSMQVVLDAEDRFAYVTDEDSATLSVFDFEDSLGSPAPRATCVGQVPLPPSPVGVALSPDGRHLFVTSQHRRTRGAGGVLSVLLAADAQTAPAAARVRSVPAGHNPVRVAVSPARGVAWVTARGSNALLAFDAERLVSGRGRSLRAVVPVGVAPVGLALLAGGATVVVANSNRYAAEAGDAQTLSVIDADAALRGRGALLGAVPAGAFPREMAVLPDDRTVLVTNAFSESFEAVAVLR